MKAVRPDWNKENADATALRNVMLVPGADVPLLRLDLPTGLRGQAREQVALRQMRDEVGLSGDAIEIRPFAPNDSSDTWDRVLVANASLMSQWRQMAGPECIAVLPDYLGLPAAPRLWVLSVSQGQARARLGVNDGFAVEEQLLPDLLLAALNDPRVDQPEAILCGDPLAAEIVELFEKKSIRLVTDAAALKALDFEVPRVLAHGERQFDLRSDPRAARARLRRQVLPWRWPLLLAILTACLWAGDRVAQTQSLQDAAQAERAEATRLARAHFITSGPILDLRTQVSRALAEQTAATASWQGRVSPLALIGQAADVVAAQKARPELLNYEPATGLNLIVRVSDFAAVDRLEAALRAAGLEATVTEAQTSGGAEGVQADLRIRPGQPEQVEQRP